MDIDLQIQAAEDVIGVMGRLAQKNTNLALAALAGSRQFQTWRHYPRNDADDPANGTRFYYHAHAPEDRAADEHGHFHVFAHAEPAKILPNGQLREEHKSKPAGFHHLAAIALDHLGWPTRLFLTNRWVTDESWISQAQSAGLIRRFRCVQHGRLAPVGLWLSAMMRLYQPELIELHQSREKWFKHHAQGRNDSAILQAQEIKEICSTAIDLPARLHGLVHKDREG